MFRFRTLSVILLSTAALSALGCGGSSGPDRFPLSGDVSFKGAPVAEGSIRFVPENKSEQPEGAPIKDGKYSTSLTAGKKQVIIEAFRPKDAKANEPKRPGGVPLAGGGAIDTEMYIPEQYNTKSTLEVVAGPDTSKHDFTLP
jgi:hypothetical protein